MLYGPSGGAVERATAIGERDHDPPTILGGPGALDQALVLQAPQRRRYRARVQVHEVGETASGNLRDPTYATQDQTLLRGNTELAIHSGR